MYFDLWIFFKGFLGILPSSNNLLRPLSKGLVVIGVYLIVNKWWREGCPYGCHTFNKPTFSTLNKHRATLNLMLVWWVYESLDLNQHQIQWLIIVQQQFIKCVITRCVFNTHIFMEYLCEYANIHGKNEWAIYKTLEWV